MPGMLGLEMDPGCQGCLLIPGRDPNGAAPKKSFPERGLWERQLHAGNPFP